MPTNEQLAGLACFTFIYTVTTIIVGIYSSVYAMASAQNIDNDINNIQFQGMEQIVADWKSPFITDVFVIDKD